MPLSHLLYILCLIESGNSSTAIGDNGKAVGVLQIHPIMIEEVNRIASVKGISRRYKLSDRLSKYKSKQIASIYLIHQRKRYIRRYNREPTYIELGCSWNSGSIFKRMPKAYKTKITQAKKEKAR